MAELHADAAAARGALQHDGIADAMRLLQRRAGLFDQVAARQQRRLGARGEFARGVLQAEGAHMLRPRPDEFDPLDSESLGEAGVLAQETIAGMHRLRAGLLARRNHRLNVEIALRRRRRPEPHALVGGEHRRREAVRVGTDSDRSDAHLAQGADDAPGDFAAIGDENFAEHRRLLAGRVKDHHADRRRVEAVAWIIDLRAVGEQA